MSLNNTDLIALLRDLQSRTDNVRDFLSTEIRELKESLEEKLEDNTKATNARLDLLEKRVLEHDRRWDIFKTVFSWAFSGVSLAAVTGILFNYVVKLFWH